MDWLIVELLDDEGACLLGLRAADGAAWTVYRHKKEAPLRAALHPDGGRLAVDSVASARVRGKLRTRVGLVNLERQGMGWLRLSLDPKWRVGGAAFDDQGRRLAIEGYYDEAALPAIYVFSINPNGNSLREEMIAGAGSVTGLACVRPIFLPGGAQLVFFESTSAEGDWALRRLDLDEPGTSAGTLKDKGAPPSVGLVNLTDDSDAVPEVGAVTDGERLFFVGRARGGKRQRLRWVSLEGGHVHDLFKNHLKIESLCIDRQGARLAWAADGRVWISDIDGEPRCLLEPEAGRTHTGLSFTPDGQALFFASNDPDGGEVCRVDMAGRVEVLTKLEDVTLLGLHPLPPNAARDAYFEAEAKQPTSSKPAAPVDRRVSTVIDEGLDDEPARSLERESGGQHPETGAGTAQVRLVDLEPKAEPPKAEAPKVEPPKAEPPKPPKAEPSKAEPPKAEPPKAEPPKAEPPKAEPPKAELPKVELPRPKISLPPAPPAPKLSGLPSLNLGGGGLKPGLGVPKLSLSAPSATPALRPVGLSLETAKNTLPEEIEVVEAAEAPQAPPLLGVARVEFPLDALTSADEAALIDDGFEALGTQEVSLNAPSDPALDSLEVLNPALDFLPWLKRLSREGDPSERLKGLEAQREDMRLIEACEAELRRRLKEAADDKEGLVLIISAAAHLELRSGRALLKPTLKRARQRVEAGDLPEIEEHYALAAVRYIQGDRPRFTQAVVFAEYERMYTGLVEILEARGEGAAAEAMSNQLRLYKREIDQVLTKRTYSDTDQAWIQMSTGPNHWLPSEPPQGIKPPSEAARNQEEIRRLEAIEREELERQAREREEAVRQAREREEAAR
ncbi:hypothetical protein KJ940_06560, partial [Myxococcota bacterium]|nr:hypothetical protein [Myxococcota bacterium]